MISFVPLAVFGSVCNGADLSAVDVEASRVACEVTAAGVRLDLLNQDSSRTFVLLEN